MQRVSSDLQPAWSRIDFNTQEDHAAKGKPAAEGDSSAQRLKEAVSSIFSVSGALRSRHGLRHASDCYVFDTWAARSLSGPSSSVASIHLWVSGC